MNKQLLIIRHAKSAWPEDVSSDFDRPLEKRGETEADNLGHFLKKENILPDFVVCSAAKRTRKTWKIINKVLCLPEDKISLTDQIYEASYKDIFKLTTELDNKHQLVAIVGHNPGVSDIINYFLGKPLISLPPAGTVLLEFPFNDWKMLSSGTAEVKTVYRPEK